MAKAVLQTTFQVTFSSEMIQWSKSVVEKNIPESYAVRRFFREYFHFRKNVIPTREINMILHTPLCLPALNLHKYKLDDLLSVYIPYIKKFKLF